MTRSMRIRGIIILVGFVLCLFYVYPTVRWALYTDEQRLELAGDPAEEMLGRWREEELNIGDDFFSRFGFAMRKWAQGDRDRVLNLGLDLQGGMYVVLEVQLEDAVAVQNQNVREQIKDSLERANAPHELVHDTSPTTIEITCETIEQAQRALEILHGETDYHDRLRLPERGTLRQPSFTVHLTPRFIEQTRHNALDQARRVVQNRIDELGLTEPDIQVQRPDRIIVQLPGEQNPDRVLRLLQQTARLQFHLVAPDSVTRRVIDSIDRVERIKDRIIDTSGRTREGTPFDGYSIRDTDTDFFRILLNREDIQERIPPQYMLMLGRPVPDPSRGLVLRELALISRDVAIDGMSIRNAQSTLRHTTTDREVALTLDGAGRSRLSSVSRQAARRYDRDNIVSRLAIILDDIIYSSPTLVTHIEGNPVIQGNFTEQEARDLALVLRSGALPARMEVIQNRTVGATLGADSVRRGVISAILGLACVLVFMAVYYLGAGLIANLALILNILILLGALAFFRATLTLPGIAGIILTIGMAVDANVLIFERIREEKQRGKELKRAIREGFGRAYITILDANVTTILTAIILFFLGTGPIRGFALTLIIGIGASMITALFVSRFLFDFLCDKGVLTSVKMFQFFERPSIDFLGKRHIATIISLSIIVIGLGIFTVRARHQDAAVAEGRTAAGTSLFTLPIYGVELTGGDMVRIGFNEEVPIATVREVLATIDMADSMIQHVGDGREILVRTAFNSSTNVIVALNEQLAENNPEVLEVDRIGPTVGSELKARAIWSILIALGFIIIYIWWRFEFYFGVAAIGALAHDVLITLGIFAFTGHQITLGVIAALLTVVGYSLNDTIVVFDRIREDMHIERKLGFKNILNLSINQTLSRTILTSLTTLIVVLFLYIFGGDVIRDFSFALLVGVIVGTYSSIFVASPLLLLMQRKK